MVNDHLSDFVTRVRNGYMAGKDVVEMRATKMVERVAQVLVKSGYLAEVGREGEKLIIKLKYTGKEPAVMGMRRVSKPGARIYTQVKELPRVWGGLGINIVSTPKGVVADREAKKLNSGGELLMQVW